VWPSAEWLERGLDAIQLSFQDSTRELNDFLSSTKTFELKSKVAKLIKQYDFMFRIFSNAHRRILAAWHDDERRRILKILGDSALEEHAQWILMHRERSIDQREIVKLS